MMCAICGVRKGALFVVEKNRRDESEIRQMRSASERIVERGDITGIELEPLDRGAHGKRSGAEMNRDVRSLRDQLAAGVEDRA